jgi:hypothetical protein
MFQEFEGQKPIVISRNHMDRTRPKLYRWKAPKDWSPEWNMQMSIMTGAASGLITASYLQIHTPLAELHRFYMFPGSIAQARIFLREAYKSETFQKGFGSRLAFYSTFGLTFNTARFYLWRDLNGGFTVDDKTIDIGFFKKLIASAFVGASTAWITVPFFNVARRYHQDTVLPKEHSRGYRGYMHAAYVIARKDGLLPFTRSSVPLMLQYTLETSGTLFWTDFAKDKCYHLKNYGGPLGGFSDFSMKVGYLSFGTFFGLLYGYSFDSVRKSMEMLPKNAKGETYFANYAEAGMKTLGEYYNIYGAYSGFGKHLLRSGPTMFMTLWFADSLGLLDVNRVSSIIEAE